MVKVNLLPETRRSTGLLDRVNRTMLLGFIGVVAVLVMVPITFDRLIANETEKNLQTANLLTSYNTAVAKITPMKASYKTMTDRLEWYYSVAGTGLDPAAILKEIQVTIPGDVWVTSMTLAGDNTATISGMSLGFEAVSQFMSQIRLSPYFTFVDLQTSVLQSVGAQEAVSFQLKVNMNHA